MKSIVILTVYVSAAFARVLPVKNVHGPAFQYKQDNAYTSNERDRESDESFYSNGGDISENIVRAYPISYGDRQSYDGQKLASHLNANSDAWLPSSLAQITNGRSFGISEPSNSQKAASGLEKTYNLISNAWSNFSPIRQGGSVKDVNQYYNSKKFPSKIDPGFYVRAIADYLPLVSSYFSDGIQVALPTLHDGNANEVNKYYNSKKKASEVYQSFYENTNNGNLRPTNAKYNFDGASVLGSGSAYVDNNKNAASEIEQIYLDGTATRSGNFLPLNSYFPKGFVSGFGGGIRIPVASTTLQGGSAFDHSQYFNSNQAANAIDQSYYDNTAVANILPFSVKYTSNGVLLPLPTSNGQNSYDNSQFYDKQATSGLDPSYYNYISKIKSGSAVARGPVVLGGNAFDIRQFYNSQNTALDNSASYGSNAFNPVWASRQVMSPVRSVVWSKPQAYYSFFVNPATGRAVVAENLRNLELQSSNDQSSYDFSAVSK